MDRNTLDPPRTEDDEADLAVRRGRSAGGGWIVASVAAFGWCFVAGTIASAAAGFGIGLGLFAVGITRRVQYWRRIRRRLGDATVQRALWRSADAEQESPGRLVAAGALVGLLLAWQLWLR